MADAEPELKTLGRYNIERTLGKGAMGVVYEGIDPKLNRRVAIKTILKSHLDPDTAKDYSMRFSREAQAVARLNHPHIVQVYDFAEEGDIAYLVMEFIRGKELKNFFDANERFDIKEAVRIMCELLDALDFAHNAGIIHRDIKPANVMLDAQARTKLTDFGVARVQDTDRTQAERTQAGTMVGTPAYMSPEQITGGNIDKRTDVFSAGIILYQFLTGEKPFTGGGAWTIAKKIIQEDPPLPSSLNNAVTPFFDAVVNKALSKNAETRYQSAKDFGVALKRALEGQGEDDDSDKTVVGEMTAPPRCARRRSRGPRPPSAAAARRPAPRPATRKSSSSSGARSRTATTRTTSSSTCSSSRPASTPRSPSARSPSCAAPRRERPAPRRRSRRRRRPRKPRARRPRRAPSSPRRRRSSSSSWRRRRKNSSSARRSARPKPGARRGGREGEAGSRAEREGASSEKAKQEAAAELAKREAEYKKREAEAEAKRQAEAKREAKREAKEARAARRAEKARKEAEEKAKKETKRWRRSRPRSAPSAKPNSRSAKPS